MTLRRLLLAALAGFGTCGLWIAGMTLELNPELLASAADALVLSGYFVAAYAALGIAAALVARLAVSVVRRAAGPARAAVAGRLLVYGLALAPVAGAALLPDAGLHRTLLTDALAGGALPRALLAAALLGASLFAGWSVDALSRRLAGRGVPALVLPAALWLALTGGFFAWLVVRSPDVPAGAAGSALARRPAPPTEAERIVPPAAPRVPVVLLCIDGADPDDALAPLIAARELPTFRRLLRQGVWGELETLYPTLSPAIWTTIATGKAPAEHGVHHFVLFDLPGLSRPVRHFPLHSGLNFRLVSTVERLPGAPVIQVPYSSNLRRARALWDIAGESVPVGVYGWRVTWPAEEVNGFEVATGVTLLDEVMGEGGAERPLHGSVHPPEARRYLDPAELPATGAPAGDLALPELIALIAAYRPGFVAAGFYSVDAVQHRASRDPRPDGAPLSPAVGAAYRRADARLGELLAALGDSGLGDAVNLIVVSDHGFDFRHHHHTHAPPGVFIGHGPAFKRNVRVEGLSVYDVAPLVLELLGLPLAEDMPGTAAGRYRRALLDPRPARRIATYETGPAGDADLLEPPQLEETKRRLRALGYLH